MHVSAVQRHPETYEHVDPEAVGNHRRVLISELAGKSNILWKAREYGIDLHGATPDSRRILDELKGTAAKTRVLVTSGDGEETWGTVGVADNIIEASWRALVDAIEYKLRRDERRSRRQ
jgi:isopropylmalate/homocitrate/citramalate synthase